MIKTRKVHTSNGWCVVIECSSEFFYLVFQNGFNTYIHRISNYAMTTIDQLAEDIKEGKTTFQDQKMDMI